MSSGRKIITAADLDAMSPDERADALVAHLIVDLDELPGEFRERVVVTGQRLAAERRQLAE